MATNPDNVGGLRACDALDRNIERYADHGPVGHAAGRFIRTHGNNLRDYIAELTETVAAQQAMLAACFKMTGADCDGNENFRIAPRALQAVTDLRRDYDQACEELHGNGELCRAAPAGGDKHSDTCMSQYPLQTGEGYWGCDCGVDAREFGAPAGSGEVEDLVQFVHAEISAANGYTIGRLRAALLRKLQQGAEDLACEACGYVGSNFGTVHYHAGDADAECPECGSVECDEPARIIERLIRERDATSQGQEGGANG